MKHLLQSWVTQRAEKRPEAIALVTQNEKVTYGQLESDSNRLARFLRDVGCRKGDRICLLMPKSPAAILSILGILKVDCLYVPIDTASPAARISKIVQSCDNRWILANGSVHIILDELFSDRSFRERLSVGWMGNEMKEGDNFRAEFCRGDLKSYSSEQVDSCASSEDPAHILFTSGSTGTPKGVVITHSNVTHFINWAIRHFGFTESDRHSQHPPLHFDLSTFDIFGTFAAGAQLHLVPPELSLLPNKLSEFIRSAELTQWFSVPSLLHYMTQFDVVRFDDFPALRRVLWCGEPFPTAALVYWMKRLPHVKFTNLYGPTEATIASSHYTVPKCPEDDSEPIPIGSPCDGEDLLVLDEQLQPTTPGEVGDLYIRGMGLSPGYWRDPEKTQSAFFAYPAGSDSLDRIYKTGDLARIGEDGLVYFVGRADSQIKSRGYRIELGEIEAALNALPGLSQFAVVTIPTKGFEGHLICCAYASQSERNSTEICKDLGHRLPRYMIPVLWMRMEDLPRNMNGKIDRKKLKELFQEEKDEAAKGVSS